MDSSHGRKDQFSSVSHVTKEGVLDAVAGANRSAYAKYTAFFVGSSSLAHFLKYEFITAGAGLLPGSAGLLARKLWFPLLLRQSGSHVMWGRNVSLRHPASISIGSRVAIDDNCLIDARGGGEEGVRLGDDVLVARDTIVQAKTGPIIIGNNVTISSQCQLSSVTGIYLGDSVGIAGQCYIGGGRYQYEGDDKPIKDQQIYSHGPVVIEEDVWIGAGCRIMDGVRIGRGSIIGAGSVIQEEVPPYTVVVPYQKLVKLPRTVVPREEEAETIS